MAIPSTAFPGTALIGQATPGYVGQQPPTPPPTPIPILPSATFLGTSPRIYPQYLDADPIPAGTTLVAEPLNTYLIAIADAWNIGGIPGDGLWGAAPRGLVGFTSTPGFAITGGLSPGFPGFSPDDDVMEDVFEAPAAAVVHMPVMRVVRSRARKLRPAPRRRRTLTAGRQR